MERGHQEEYYPRLGASQALANALQSIKMFFMWMVGETGKKTDGMANVEKAHCGKATDATAKHAKVREIGPTPSEQLEC